MQETDTNRTESQNVEQSAAYGQEVIATGQTEQTQPAAVGQSSPILSESAAAPTNQTPVIADKPKKKRKKWIVVITAIVLAAAIGVGGWFAFPSIKGFVNDIIDEYKFPRMKFASEQEMIEYLRGTWKITKQYNNDTDKYEEVAYDDLGGVFNTHLVFTDDGYYDFKGPFFDEKVLYAEKSMGGEKSVTKEFFKENPTAEDYFSDDISLSNKLTYDYEYNNSKSYKKASIYALKTGELMSYAGMYIYEKVSTDTSVPPRELVQMFNNLKKEYGGVSEDIITQAMRGKSYETGIWSMKLGSLLDELCPDYQVKIEPYEEVKDKLSTYEEKLNSDYADCLDRTYLVTVTGRVLYNIDVPNYYSGEQDLISVLLVFDENSELIASAIPDESRDFEVSALLCMQRGY